MNIKKQPFYGINALLILFSLSLYISCSNATSKEVNVQKKSFGPENGTLLIGGGGMTVELWHIFHDFAGGDSARLVVIPTSWDENSINFDPTFEIIKKQFKGRGFVNVTVLHTRNSTIANSDEFVEPIKRANAVWLTGGRQWRTADVYFNTKTHKELRKLLARGGIIGGHSAGASIQGSFLVRGRRDKFGSYYIMGGQEAGFGFLEHTAIDQHHLARNRHYDMFELLERKPELLGIGIDEYTAILVQNNTFEVIGDRYVTIYDGTFWSPYFNDIDTLDKGVNKFYFLSNGNKYDLKKRRVIVNKYLPHENMKAKDFNEYVGTYQLRQNRYWFKAMLSGDTLKVQRTRRSTVNEAIPIFPYDKDVFFDKDSEWWFHFKRDSLGKITALVRKTHQLIGGTSQKFDKVPK